MFVYLQQRLTSGFRLEREPVTDDNPQTATALRLGLPKGRIEPAVLELLKDAGVPVTPTARGYRPVIALDDCEAKVMKPQNIVEMLDLGRRDLGFAGADWVAELNADVVELLDTRLDHVRVVAAAAESLLEDGELPNRELIVTSEYECITKRWIETRQLQAAFARSYGATEVFPPDDADVIVDNTATGATLRTNGLQILDTLMHSSTRLYASRAALADRNKQTRIEDFCLLLKSVLDARRRAMIEVNAPADRLDTVVALLPCMREATVAPLFGNSGYAVKAAVPRESLPQLIPALKSAGASDVVVSNVSQIIP